MTHWTERLFTERADAFAPFLERRIDRAPGEVDGLLDLVAEERDLRPDRVLDVACGIGRHVLAFAGEGCRAEGLDVSPEYVDRARELAAERGLDDRVGFRVHDMRDLDEWESRMDGEGSGGGQGQGRERGRATYDLVTSFWNSLGYYDRETDVGILRAMRDLLSAEGVVAIDVSNKDHVVGNFSESGVREVDGRLHVERREFDLTTGRLETTIDVFDVGDDGYDHRETVRFRPRLYAPVELREMCEAAGFEDVALYGGFDGGDPALDSSGVVVLAG